MKEIREWLANGGQDYAQGVALYAAHGKSRVLLRSLQYGATDFTRATLRRELEKLAIAGDVTTNVPSGVTTNVRVNDTVNVLVKQNATKSLQNVDSSSHNVDSSVATDTRKQRSAWFAERDFLHARLELLATDAERHASALRILDLSQLLAASYDQERGRAVSAPVATPRPDLAAIADAGEIRRLLANLRPQASKLKRNPDRAADLAQALADIHVLETKLKP
ncbi:hypothetical protein [Hymenobacter rubidus]|uniref:hypothetical protein n=1 Tax=Hymenobacter rubidus TaxID=1441626 RepID=UPI0019202231|nr:hypothetical protein [Hymenobacter rubidus]